LLKLLDFAQILHDSIKQRRPRVAWEQNHEKIMLKHVELCVDLAKPQLAKDALWQYRNMTQQVKFSKMFRHQKSLSDKYSFTGDCHQ
jgi:translation initiation factor 3 subunit A